MTVKTRNLTLLVLLATGCLLSGCERSTHVRVKGGTNPVFVLSGNGKLSSFAVYSPDFAEKAESPWDENFALWKIRPAGEYLKGIPVGQLERITYGLVPDGYTQVRPQVGSAPPLREGQKYFYQVETTNAPGAAGYIEIRNSQTVPTDGPDSCFGHEGKKWIRVRCAQ